jgi:acetyl esterase/lipase
MRLIKFVVAFTLAVTLAACGGGGSESAPPAGRLYQEPVYSASSIATNTDLTYSLRPNLLGVQYTSEARKAQELAVPGAALQLKLDLWTPPASDGNRPLLMLVHGGGFQAGGKEDMAEEALDFARAGYVVASVNYRLTPDNELDPELQEAAMKMATEDVMNAVRYLKLNAALYRIDTGRMALLGNSAGGFITLLNAVEYDTLQDTESDYGNALSSRVAAAVSTGATLVGDEFDSDAWLNYDAGDTPVLMYHTQGRADRATGATWAGNVVPTCDRINASGNTCQAVPTPEAEHTVSLSITGKWWPTTYTFLAAKLRL